MTDKLCTWIREQVNLSGMQGAVLGLSGGIDSAVVAGLAKRALGERALGVIMPCHSVGQDREHALACARAFDLKIEDVDLSQVYDRMLATLRQAAPGLDEPQMALANIKPRLRMTTLYYFANVHSYLVLGTGNRSEITVGYFTKHGDGGVDIMPIAGLVKSQVRGLAEHLGVPQAIIDKPPSAGLWENQTDEGEMGITYEELDNYILGGETKPHIKDRVDRMAVSSAHKRRLPPSPDL
jgi:NAD+ synthase